LTERDVLIIEFAGLPGSGKTTIVEHLVTLGSREVPRIVSGRRMLAGSLKGPSQILAFRAILENPRMTMSLLAFCIGTGLLHPAMFTYSARKSFAIFFGTFFGKIHLLDRNRAAAIARDEIVVLDQYLVQTLGAIAVPPLPGFSPDPASVVKLALPNRIDGIVWIDCEWETALARIRQRRAGNSRFDQWHDETARSCLWIMMNVMKKAINAAGQIPIPILRLSASESPQGNAEKVAHWLTDLQGTVSAD
jgi:thymidylate kinase